MILRDESGDHDIDWQADSGAINRRNEEHTPCAKRAENSPQKCRVTGDYVFDGVQ